MATPKRRKPTKADQKAKAVKKVSAKKAVDFDFASVREAAGERRIVLHIGCGAANPEKLHPSFRGEDWFELRYDIDPDVRPHIIGDIRDMAMLPDASVDAVWSSHNIEHLYPHDVPVALKEIYRVIRPRGHFLVTLPDIQTVATYVAHGGLEDPIYDSPAGPISPIDILYGFRSAMARGNLFMAHKTAFTAKTLAHHLRDAGFTNLRVQRKWVDLWAVGYKYEPGDPDRNEKVELLTDKKTGAMELPPALPLNRSPHPGQIARNLLSDELDIPPKEWQPPGLNT